MSEKYASCRVIALKRRAEPRWSHMPHGEQKSVDIVRVDTFVNGFISSRKGVGDIKCPSANEDIWSCEEQLEEVMAGKPIGFYEILFDLGVQVDHDYYGDHDVEYSFNNVSIQLTSYEQARRLEDSDFLVSEEVCLLGKDLLGTSYSASPYMDKKCILIKLAHALEYIKDGHSQYMDHSNSYEDIDNYITMLEYEIEHCVSHESRRLRDQARELFQQVMVSHEYWMTERSNEAEQRT